MAEAIGFLYTIEKAFEKAFEKASLFKSRV
jgi:hypothetical protein